jgi:hypothetical protein
MVVFLTVGFAIPFVAVEYQQCVMFTGINDSAGLTSCFQRKEGLNNV